VSAEATTVGIPSAGLQLFGRLRGAGRDAPTLVLLCGLGFHTFEYEPLAQRLAATGVGCLSFDFRGHGRSGGPRGGWVLDDLVTDAQHAINLAHRNARGPVMLFGNSLGAMVAIRAGADDRVAGVAAANCPARLADFMLTTPKRVLFTMLKAARQVARIRVSVNHFYRYEQLIDDPAWVSTIRNDPLIGDARRLSIPTYASLLDDWDGTRAVHALHKPLLLIQGRHDRLQPPRQSELLFEAANRPKRYELVNTGHLPHLQDPDMLADLLIGWLDGLV
jgi:alpha-beta hydrolase superfamily lysophospholipase